jgi:HYR domain
MNQILLACLILFIFCFQTKAASPENTPELYSPGMVMDTVKPLIFCPPGINVTLAPLSCDTVQHYTVTAEDDQGTVIIIQLAGLPSGAAFPVGVTVNTYLATDLAGNTATCSFSVTVLDAYLAPPTCNDLALVFLNPDCSKTATPFDILEGGPFGCPQNYIIELDKILPFGNGPWVSPALNGSDVDKTYQARVTDTRNGNKCWGNLQVKDNTPPVLTCQTISVPCALPLNELTPGVLRDSFGFQIAFPFANDACSGSITTMSFVDLLQTLPCDDTATVSGIIQRIWSATDASGNTGTCMQIIRRERLLANVQIPGTKTSPCTNPDYSTQTNGIPFISFQNRRYDITPASFCKFDWDFFDTIQPGACTGNFTVNRTWKIYDACLPFSATNPKIGVQQIQVKDTKGPVFECPADRIVTVTDNLCRASVDMPDLYLSDNCSGIAELEVFWSDSGLTKMMTGVLLLELDSTNTDSLAVFGPVASFPVGATTLLYVATDDCGNTGECSFKLTVANMTPPTAICDSILLVGLPSSGYLAMPAKIPDNASSDDCTPVTFKARLLEANSCSPELAFNDTLHICCRNLGDTLFGTLRVYDINVPAGAVSNNHGMGHFSDCNFKIRVTGSNPPICTAPANITISCEAFDPTLESYGGLVSQSCSVDSIAYSTLMNGFDTICSRGTINRQFKVFNSVGQMGQCTQKIVVNYNQEYFTRFPDDMVVTFCDTSNFYGVPTFFGKDCELITPTYEDQVFTVVPDACYKIERTWKIINWCTYNPDSSLIHVPNPNPNATSNHADNLPGPILSPVQTAGDPWKSTIVKINPSDASPTNYSVFYKKNGNGYSYKQIIKVIDTQQPVVENCPSSPLTIQDVSTNDPQLWNATYWLDPALNLNDLCEAPNEISITAYDACTSGTLNINYQLFLDLNGDGILETVVNSALMPPGGSILYNNVMGPGTSREFDFRPVAPEHKWRFANQVTKTGNKTMASIRFNTSANPNVFSSAQIPHGTHKVKWLVSDGCGNEKICEYSFTVRDGKPPAVACSNNLTINFTASGVIHVHLPDMLSYSEDNCTPQDKLTYSIRKFSSGTGFPTDSLGNPIDSVSYYCNEVGLRFLEVWAKDVAGNVDFCDNATVILQDNNNICTSNPVSDIRGFIKTETNEGIADVSLNLNSNLPFVPPFPWFLNIKTDTLGYFQFPSGMTLSSTATLGPVYDANPLNGITTFDLVLISKHILGIQALGSPYKMIAADANKSSSITTFDIVELRKLILGIYQELPANTSWRFVKKSHVFSNPMNPFMSAIPEVIPASELFLPNMTDDFVGVKIGDVNNTAVAHAGAPLSERSAGALYFKVAANGRERVQAGEVFDLQFSATAPMDACQFTLSTPGLEILEIVPGENMGQEHFAWFPEKKALTLAWETGGIANFSLKCRASTSAALSDLLALGSTITPAAAYQSGSAQQAVRFDLGLQYSDKPGFELYQNYPNPFDGSTDISFNLPEAAAATLKIFDAHGRLIFTQSGDFTRGVHTIRIEKSAIEAVGVLFYQLETTQESATRKMIKL